MQKIKARGYWDTLTIPTYTRQPERQLPFIFQKQRNIYPERRDDLLGGNKQAMTYSCLVLENAFLRLTLIPDLGGKVWSVYDKNAKQETLYVPDCVKPGLILHPGAWIPGGIEFNFPIGHHPRTMRNVPCTLLNAGPAQAVAVISQTCRRTGMRMNIHVRLPADEARFHIDYEILNPTPLDHSWYQWTNLGMLATDGWQFLSKARWFTAGNSIRPYPIGETGIDNSYFRNRHVASDTFMVAHAEDFAGCYDHDRRHGLAHVAPWRQMPGKKYFTWGYRYPECSDGEVFCDNGAHYVEIQFSPFETQMERAMLAAGSGLSYGETWIPFHQIGGLEWADEHLLFNVRDDGVWLYAAVPLQFGMVVNGKTITRALRPGQPTRLDVSVRSGDQIELHVDNRLMRAFRHPLKGRLEPGGVERARKQYTFKPQPLQSPADYLRAARAAAVNDNWADAVGHFRKALAKAPAATAARLELADALWHTGDFKGGELELRKLLRSGHAGQARRKLARRAEAESDFCAAARVFPPGPRRELALAENHAGYGGYDLAHAKYRQLARQDSKNPRVHFGLAMYYNLIRHDSRQALRHARLALRHAACDRDYIVELAPLFIDAGRGAEALQWIQSAAPATRQLSFVRKMMVRANFELGNFEQCQKLFKVPAPLHSWEGDLLMVDLFRLSATALAEQALQQGRLDRAEQWVLQIDKLPATLGSRHRALGYPGTGYWLGLIAARRGDSQKARNIWRESIAAWEHERVTRADYFDFVLDWQVHGYENLYLMGMCALQLDDEARARALAFCREAVKGFNSLFLKGVAAELEGDFKNATRHYQAHLDQSPGSARIARLHLEAMARGRRRGEL